MSVATDKETRAIFLNFKELRCLEKNLQILDIEKEYAERLIGVHQKDMKIHYRKIKDKVAKIRSHLTPQQIDEMKTLEAKGAIKPPSNMKSNSAILIHAAEKRLKLQPRAKSAVPRLGQSLDEEGLRNARSVRATQSAVTRSVNFAGNRTAISENDSSRPSTARSAMSNGALSPATHGGSYSVSGRNGNKNEVTVSGPVPESLRRTRKLSIFVDTASPVKPVEIKIENADSSGNNDADKSAHFSKQLTLNIPKNNNTGISNSTNTSPRSKLSPTRTMSPKSPNSNLTSSPASSGKGNVNFVDGGSWATKTSTYLQLPSQASERAHTEQGQSCIAHPGSQDGSVSLSVPMISPGGFHHNRPTNIPATPITNYDDGQGHISTNAAQKIALETRKKSVEVVRRVSNLLREGKTRVPFDSHDYMTIDERAKAPKPFRSIREKTFSINIDNEINDESIGDDLYKEMKRGMLLGEVATGLYLEDKMDQFEDRVNEYIRENPNYVYDPEKTRAEIAGIREAHKASKQNKRSKNTLRRRQLERKLLDGEAAMREAAKARYIRLGDDQLDMTGVQTLVVDQMKMLRSLKVWQDE